MKIIPDYFTRAVCDTLIHSLWLGLLLAAAAGLMVLCTRRSSARFRYNLLIAGLAIFSGAVLFTFLQALNVEDTSRGLTLETPVTFSTSTAMPVHIQTGNYGVITGLMNAYANKIVFVWLLIVLARTIQLFTGLQSLFFLRRRNNSIIDGHWDEYVKALARQLGIRRVVCIAESGIARVPMVIGHLKPLILIPAGLLTALPPEGIEAILIHELAHIRRSDYLVNMLVSVLEIVFFFNPAVLWLAALIREERENCCDDMALAHTANKSDYIKALVACQEYQQNDTAYAMAFSGRKKHLLGRVKRMLSNSNSSLNVTERAVLAVVLLTTVVLTAAFSNTDKIDKLVNKVKFVAIAPPLVPKQIKPKEGSDQTPPGIKKEKKPMPAANDAAHKADTTKFKIYKPEQIGNHTNVSINNGNLQTRLVKIDGTLYQLNSLADRLVSLQVNGNTVSRDEQTRYLGIVDAATQPAARVAAVARQADPDPISPIDPIAPLQKTPVNLKQEPDYKTSADLYREQTKAYHDDTNLKKLTTELIADGIIKSKGELLSFRLSDTEFIVNGKKLQDETYKKYRKAYVKSPEKGKQGSWAWLYNYDE